ncbi:high-affinity zinc uptake system binding-protein ZnuA [Geobacter sp. OR-1]|uniref:metal ABC transporter substrate-binding protein n=1 Tax=Geobacter sp. OR-1 TaxID=1266765 RepID=UPI0005438A8D|nr:metal ABC transporter substrate-binding protein [Geobacter sp. OR-1]GAM09616.1 high-affinity zinc uptake system binding-protein ZnuA [Geobacter sp. OR-1]
MRIGFFLFVIGIALAVAAGCNRKGTAPELPETGFKVVTTLFPLYDMARAICGDKAEVVLLIPPGVEPHHFEPRPDDMVLISKAALFIYTSRYMEPWADKLLRGVGSKRLTVINASDGLRFLPAGDRHEHDGHAGEAESHPGGMDPHVWLDLANSAKMVDLILAGVIGRDPGNRAFYEANASSYKKRLADLDLRYQQVLGNCGNRTLVHAGHFAFGYLAARYKLDYLAATGVTADAEPTPARLAELVNQVRKLGIKAVFTEELVSPKLAETLAGETGAEILRLHAGHNVGRDELARGITFPALMEQNLVALEKGLQCRR